MLRPVVISLLLLAALSDAMVIFNNSAILDEFDFANASVSVTGLCRDLCHVYASIDQQHRGISDKLLIQTAKGFISVSKVADQLDSTTKKKFPLELKNMPTLTITNLNEHHKSGSIILYVVNKNADYFEEAEVYEAAGLDRPKGYARVITILSYEPFTLQESNYMSMGVIAKLAGFDTLDGTECPAVYSLSWLPFPGFQIAVIGPIISLMYDLKQFPYPAGELKATGMFSDTHRMEQNGFLVSAGWHGCNGKPAYQSTLYDNNIEMWHKLVDENTHPQDVTINVQTNARERHAVVVTGSDNQELARYYDNQDSVEIQQFRDYKLTFAFTYTTGTHYLVRYNSTAKPVY